MILGRSFYYAKEKNLVSIGISLIISIFLTTPTFAASSQSWDYGSNYTNQYGSYVPYKGNANYTITGTSTDRLLTFSSNIYFNQTVVNAIQNYMNQNRYFTWDVSNTNDNDTTISATGWYTTNLPNPKFDYEDDPYPFGNGYKDETEVTVLSLVSPNIQYYYLADFQDRRNGTSSGTVEYRACISEKSLTGEYNTVYISSRAQAALTYGSNPGQYSISDPNTEVISKEELNSAEIHINDNKSQILDLYAAIDSSSLKGLKEYKNKVISLQEELHNAKKNNILTTITFNSPLSIDSFSNFVRDHNIKVTQFAVRAIDKNGDRVTISGKPSETDIVPKEILNSMLEKSQTDFKGIIECYCELGFEELEIINNDDKVFLADTSADDTFTKNSFTKHIPSIYWYVENDAK